MLMQIKNKKGFTLIELIVGVSIIFIVSTIYIMNYRSGGRKADLRMAEQKLASDIRVMQNNSMSLKDFAGSGLGGGWGIHLGRDDDKYELFVDLNNDRLYDDATEKYREIFFPEGIQIIDENFEGLNSENNSFGAPGKRYLSVIFAPPDPLVHIDARRNYGSSHVSDELDCNLVKIKLIDVYGNEKHLTINKFGLVEIE